MYSSRADSVLIENHLPEFDPSIPDVQAKGHSNSTIGSKSSEIIRKPIAGERESEIVLSRFQTKIGKNFLLENFLPSKQQIPSTIEGKIKISNEHQFKFKFINTKSHTEISKYKILNIPHMITNILGYPDWFIPSLRFVLQQKVRTPCSPSLRFELSQQAAEHNKALLQQHGNNLQNYILTQKDTHIYFGAEF